MTHDWKRIQRQRTRKDMKDFLGSAAAMMAGGLFFTMPLWMILLGII